MMSRSISLESRWEGEEKKKTYHSCPVVLDAVWYDCLRGSTRRGSDDYDSFWRSPDPDASLWRREKRKGVGRSGTYSAGTENYDDHGD